MGYWRKNLHGFLMDMNLNGEGVGFHSVSVWAWAWALRWCQCRKVEEELGGTVIEVVYMAVDVA